MLTSVRQAVLGVLVVFVAQTLLPPSLRYLHAKGSLRSRLLLALGPRDEAPELPVLGARAARALANMHEALPVFLALALLHLQRGAPSPATTNGAWVFLLARSLYVPAYLSGIPGVRSVVWSVGFLSLGVLFVTLLEG